MEIVPFVLSMAMVAYLHYYEEKRKLLHTLPYALLLVSLILFLVNKGSSGLSIWAQLAGLITFLHLVSCWKFFFWRK